MKRKYDLVFGLGAACSCSEILRRVGLQHLSFPFDWLYGGSFVTRTRLLAENGEGWLQQEVLIKQASPEWHDKDIYQNGITGISFNHDFPKGVPLERSFPCVAEKYKRRFARLNRLIESSKTVLMVYLGTPQMEPLTEADLRAGLDCVQARYPKTRFELLYFRCDKNVPVSSRTEKLIGDKIKIVAFDYKDPKPGRYDYLVDQGILATFFADFAVNDYRTPEERRAHRKAKRLARYAKYGATNLWSFSFRRVASHVSDAAQKTANAVRLAVRRLWRRTSVKRHDVFVSLGYNCELAFRYFKSNGFVDSGLFQWAISPTLDHLTHAIEHLDLLFTGEIKEPNPLYQCANTQIRQHGKAPVGHTGEEGTQTVQDLEADREDLRGRIAHLKGKFVKSLSAGGALVAYKIRTAEFLADTAEEKLNRLICALRRLGMKDATFLLVCEAACKVKSVNLNWPESYVRYVKSYNPDEHVTDAELGDPVGWQLLFDEFKPRVVKKQAHKFKFEK